MSLRDAENAGGCAGINPFVDITHRASIADCPIMAALEVIEPELLARVTVH